LHLSSSFSPQEIALLEKGTAVFNKNVKLQPSIDIGGTGERDPDSEAMDERVRSFRSGESGVPGVVMLNEPEALSLSQRRAVCQ